MTTSHNGHVIGVHFAGDAQRGAVARAALDAGLALCLQEQVAWQKWTAT